MGQALFLVLNSLDVAAELAKDLLPFQVIQKVVKLYTEDPHNQIRPIYSSLARQQLTSNLILLRVSYKGNKQAQIAVAADYSHRVLIVLPNKASSTKEA